MLIDKYFRENNAVFAWSDQGDPDRPDFSVQPVLVGLGANAGAAQSIVDALNHCHLRSCPSRPAKPVDWVKVTQENLDTVNRALARPPAAFTDPRNAPMTPRQDMEDGDQLTHVVTGELKSVTDLELKVAALEHRLNHQLADKINAAAGHAREVEQKVQAFQHELGQRIESVALSLSQLRSATGSTFESIADDQEEDRRRIGQALEYLTDLHSFLTGPGPKLVDAPMPPWPWLMGAE